MPWCPKCKTEYQDGFTVCNDCKVDLTDSLEEDLDFVPFVQTEDEIIADKLVRYFKYSEIESEVQFDEENEVYIVNVPSKQETMARKLYQAFYFVERDNFMNGENDNTLHSDHASTRKKKRLKTNDLDPYKDGEDTDNTSEMSDEDFLDTTAEEENTSEDPSNDDVPEYEEERATDYVMKADQYKDLSGTVSIFLLFGVVGLIVVILNAIGILTFLNGMLPLSVMGVVFLSFIYIALSTNKKAKTVQSEIEAENILTDKINHWMDENITEDFISTLHNDTISDELNYIKKLDTIKELLLKEFGPQNLAYLDRLIDDYYTRKFE